MSKTSSQGGSPIRISRALRHLLLALGAFLTLLPILWVIRIALSGTNTFQGADLSPWPTTWSSANFAQVVSARDQTGTWLFGRQLLNSIAVSVLTTLFGIGVACTAAYAFSRFRFVGRRSGLFMFLVSQMFPGILMMVPLYVIMQKAHLLDTIVGLVLVYSITSVPFSVWMLKGYFDTIPRDLEEAARIDGAGRFRIFWSIILPLARPALVVTGLFSFMTAWNEFILAATFMGDERSFTLPVVLQGYVGDFGTEWGRFAAGAILVSLPVMALFFALQRHLVEGLTAGSVKG